MIKIYISHHKYHSQSNEYAPLTVEAINALFADIVPIFTWVKMGKKLHIVYNFLPVNILVIVMLTCQSASKIFNFLLIYAI